MQPDPAIAALLGTAPTFSCAAQDFADAVQRATSLASGGNMWPLVSRVRVWCNAPVLRTGVVLVDLPGAMDSNRARAAVYKDYVDRCDVFWVVAPMKRAVTDHVAHGACGRQPVRRLSDAGTRCRSPGTSVQGPAHE